MTTADGRHFNLITLYEQFAAARAAPRSEQPPSVLTHIVNGPWQSLSASVFVLKLLVSGVEELKPQVQTLLRDAEAFVCVVDATDADDAVIRQRMVDCTQEISLMLDTRWTRFACSKSKATTY